MNLWSGGVLKTPKVGQQEVYERSCVCTRGGFAIDRSSSLASLLLLRSEPQQQPTPALPPEVVNDVSALVQEETSPVSNNTTRRPQQSSGALVSLNHCCVALVKFAFRYVYYPNFQLPPSYSPSLPAEIAALPRPFTEYLLNETFRPNEAPSTLVVDSTTNRINNAVDAHDLALVCHNRLGDLVKDYNSREYWNAPSSLDITSERFGAEYNHWKLIVKAGIIMVGHREPSNTRYFTFIVADRSASEVPLFHLHCNEDDGSSLVDSSTPLTMNQVFDLMYDVTVNRRRTKNREEAAKLQRRNANDDEDAEAVPTTQENKNEGFSLPEFNLLLVQAVPAPAPPPTEESDALNNNNDSNDSTGYKSAMFLHGDDSNAPNDQRGGAAFAELAPRNSSPEPNHTGSGASAAARNNNYNMCVNENNGDVNADPYKNRDPSQGGMVLNSGSASVGNWTNPESTDAFADLIEHCQRNPLLRQGTQQQLPPSPPSTSQTAETDNNIINTNKTSVSCYFCMYF